MRTENLDNPEELRTMAKSWSQQELIAHQIFYAGNQAALEEIINRNFEESRVRKMLRDVREGLEVLNEIGEERGCKFELKSKYTMKGKLKMTPMRVIKWVVGCAVGLMLGLWLLSLAFTMISSPDDFAVIGGVLLLAALISAVAIIGTKIVRSFTRKQAEKVASQFAVIAFIALAFTSCERINAGYAGIKINNYGSSRGVQDVPLVTGLVWYNPLTQDVLEYPCFVQTAKWEKEEALTFNVQGGIIATVDVSISYQFTYDKVPAFWVKFRSDDIEKFTHGFLRNIARDAFNEVAPKYTVEDLYGEKKETMMKDVRDRVNAELNPIGAHIEQFGFLHAISLPPQITQAMNNKAQAIQNAIRVENELRETEAAAKKRIASAMGEAKSNELLTKSITPELVEWRKLDIQRQAIEKWNGVRPTVESGTGSGLLMQLPVPGKQ